MTTVSDRQRRMCTLLRALAAAEGYTQSALPGVRWLRSDRPLERTPVLYEPGIVFVCQGRKRGLFGDEWIVYDARHYLAVAVPVPFTMETDASSAEPLLAIYMRLDPALAAELLLAMERHRATSTTCQPKGLAATRMDDRIEAALLRFLEAMSDPLEAEVLVPGLLREIYFHVLSGEQGASMRAALTAHGHLGRIALAPRRIHSAYAQPLDVPALAREAGLGLAAFHLHFKTVTQTSPMQYLKSIRLHRARLLMFRQGSTAAAAAHQVGYESPSQFSREFKRLFGRSPTDELARMRQSLALTPSTDGEAFVSSH
ncbi:AraC family transcriptional regulator [Aquabacterium sp. A7-Y]|uniref:AraC family transcriptional regulator n=1 Tax=Aquabacterium sp. A7-Y TaxID=1349605 RepID=UPI00223CFC0A|nr:AraC family transcriptional regulator [Aquabacterium sp. A7-Y]MCW7541749.1 AraC family transcriptional regulator [Aquabacterium sp. A7-Y]